MVGIAASDDDDHNSRGAGPDGTGGRTRAAWDTLLHSSEQRTGGGLLLHCGHDGPDGGLSAAGIMVTGIESTPSDAALRAVEDLQDRWQRDDAHELLSTIVGSHPADDDQHYSATLRSAIEELVGEPGALAIVEATVQKRPCDFFCRCSKAHFLKQLGVLPPADVACLVEDANAHGACELTCHHCNEMYQITAEEITGQVATSAG